MQDTEPDNTSQFNVGEAVLLKREQKRKGETSFEPHIYIITNIIGSTIQARRANDQKTVCRDASKFKLLRTDDFPTEDKERETTTIPVVPPTYQETQRAVTQDTITQCTPAVTTPTTQTQPLRRSQRQTNCKSTFDGHLKDYSA